MPGVALTRKVDRLHGLRQFRLDVVGRLKALGWRYVTLDLEGFRSGSMNPPQESS